jgi:hypothetical protein
MRLAAIEPMVKPVPRNARITCISCGCAAIRENTSPLARRFHTRRCRSMVPALPAAPWKCVTLRRRGFGFAHHHVARLGNLRRIEQASDGHCARTIEQFAHGCFDIEMRRIDDFRTDDNSG